MSFSAYWGKLSAPVKQVISFGNNVDPIEFAILSVADESSRYFNFPEGGKAEEDVDLALDVDSKKLNSCGYIDIGKITKSLPVGANDSERFVEPLIGNLIWLTNWNIKSLFLGNGIYSSKTKFVNCMTAYYLSADIHVENNNGIYRGNTLSTFPFEAGFVGMLLILTSLVKFIVRSKIELQIFTFGMAFSVLLTNITFNGTFILLIAYTIVHFVNLKALNYD